jgi:hypothetical protein
MKDICVAEAIMYGCLEYNICVSEGVEISKELSDMNLWGPCRPVLPLHMFANNQPCIKLKSPAEEARTERELRPVNLSTHRPAEEQLATELS